MTKGINGINGIMASWHHGIKDYSSLITNH